MLLKDSSQDIKTLLYYISYIKIFIVLKIFNIINIFFKIKTIL